MNFLFQSDMRILNDLQFAMTRHLNNFSVYYSAIHVIFSDINVILFVNLLTIMRMTLNLLSDRARMKFRISI